MFTTLFGRSDSARQRAAKFSCRRLQLERLSNRELLAIDIDLAPASEDIEVKEQDGEAMIEIEVGSTVRINVTAEADVDTQVRGWVINFISSDHALRLHDYKHVSPKENVTVLTNPTFDHPTRESWVAAAYRGANGALTLIDFAKDKEMDLGNFALVAPDMPGTYTLTTNAAVDDLVDNEKTHFGIQMNGSPARQFVTGDDHGDLIVEVVAADPPEPPEQPPQPPPQPPQETPPETPPQTPPEETPSEPPEETEPEPSQDDTPPETPQQEPTDPPGMDDTDNETELANDTEYYDFDLIAAYLASDDWMDDGLLDPLAEDDSTYDETEAYV